jgi:hypothetical protein
MASLTFDTLKYANRLKSAGVPDKQAEAEAEALSEVLEINLKELSTQQDIAGLRKDMEQMETRLNARLDAQRENLRSEISDSKAELIRWVVGVGLLQISLITALMVKLLPS